MARLGHCLMCCMALLMVTALVLPARAQQAHQCSSRSYETVEWQAWAADAVVIAVIESQSAPDSNGNLAVRARVTEVLKGDPPRPLRFRCSRPHLTTEDANVPQVIFLQLKTGAQEWELSDWSRTIPVTGKLDEWVGVDLVRRSGVDALHLVRAELAVQRPKPGVSVLRGDVLPCCFTHQSVMHVPPGSVPLALALKWAADPHPCVRYRAAHALLAFSDARATAALMHLLNDPFTTTHDSGRSRHRLYPIRSFVHEQLSARIGGSGVPTPVVVEPKDLYRRFPSKVARWTAAAVLGAMILWRLIRGPGPFRPLPLRFTATVRNLALALSMLFGVMWFVSHYRYDHYARPQDPFRFEICSAQGSLRVVLLESTDPWFPKALPRGLATFRPGDGLAESWDVPGSFGGEPQRRWLGLWRTGYTIGHAGPRQVMYDWRVIVLPYWLLIICPPMIAFALHLLTARVLRLVYAWRRICWTCGYDMRATPERCPECGTVIPGNVPTPARVLKQLREQEREEREMRQAEEKYHDALAGTLERMTKKDEV